MKKGCVRNEAVFYSRLTTLNLKTRLKTEGLPLEQCKHTQKDSNLNVPWKKIISIAVALVMLIGLLPVMTVSAAAAPGEVEINKTADVSGAREYTVNLTVKGNGLTTSNPADIILILDRSGSMAWEMGNDTNPESGEPSRMTVLKDSANAFVDSVLASGLNNRVAVVTYSGEGGNGDAAYNDSNTLIGLLCQRQALSKPAMSGLTPNGGTNMQAGFREAYSVIAGARAGVDRIVIFMTDGMPTYHYNGSGFTEGPGGSFDATGQANAIAQALALKNDYAAKIYTVGIVTSDADGNIQDTLNPTGANQYQVAYYHTTTASGLSEIYDTLSETILLIATGAVVTDEIHDGFTLIAGSIVAPAGTSAVVTGTPADRGSRHLDDR